jgi:hypothetical protein
MSCTLLLIAAALLSAPAWADPPEAPAPEVRFKTRTVLDFGSVTLQGQVTRPEGTLIMGHRRARFKTLIRVRGGFTPELLRSAERL